MSTPSSASGGHIVILSGPTPWSGSAIHVTPKVKPARATNRARASAKDVPAILHPIFMDISKLTDDPYWQRLFIDSSGGTLPRGFRYQSGILTYRVRAKTITTEINESSPVDAYREARKFFAEKGSLASERDIESNRRDEETMAALAATSDIDNWSKLRGTHVRNNTISFYVQEIGDKYDLSISDRSLLNSTIQLGISAGYFNNTTIIVRNGCIEHINGLIRNSDGSFDIDKDSTKSKIKKAKRRDDSDDEHDDYTSMSLESSVASFRRGDSGSRKPVIHNAWSRFLTDWEKKKRHISHITP